jgi:copper transport protein
MQAESLIHWSVLFWDYVGFVAQFLALGAVGFRFAAVGDRQNSATDPAERTLYADALQRAAVIGFAGILVQTLTFVSRLPQAAARAHVAIAQLVTGTLQTGATCVLFAAAIIGLALAAARRPAGWRIALVGVVFAPLTGVFSGRWLRLVNPLHRIAAGLWLGTLFVLAVAGLAVVLREVKMRERRGAIAADMVHGFSPLALICGLLVVLSGLITTATHLKPLSSLWTTPYGYALIVKLCLVALVFAFGAWNWRRLRPTMGSEDAAHAMRRSSRAELIAAALVLAATAVLVSLPSPKPAGAPPPQLPPAATP